ncbi:SIGNAL-TRANSDUCTION SENSOR PROTEIN-PAS/PAC domain [hydrothermal vent metagenome]|uniref:SIGNAL-TRANSDUCTION SENSOR PROTEIN-PAS/PAC domain n=1 Tax=hydrothermal vent metagenome TaxID=652676 RepID=A0A1W1C432_9ZZZZ
MQRPEPLDKEKVLDPKRYIVSKTDPKGIITYGNDYFVEISGYSEAELIGKPHNIIRHPDMPKIVFKLMWDRIKKGENIMAVVKNLAKDGSYYWVVTEFESKVDPLTGEIISYTAFRKAASKDMIAMMEPIYKKLVEIETTSGMEESEAYLKDLLTQKGENYDEFINDVVGNKGIFKIFFSAMKKFFG